MTDILLSTMNARYIHCAFGLRYLLANMGTLHSRTGMLEFDIHAAPEEVVAALAACRPRIVGLGVYIWNVAPLTDVARLLKAQYPEIILVLGGPEVSHEWDRQEMVGCADVVLCGEADLAFAELCHDLLAGHLPPQKVIQVAPPALDSVALPYAEYTPEDVAHRVIYVETSRGCPFQCDYCMSALDKSVRYFDRAVLYEQFERLLARGVRHFKFVDRSFNLDPRHMINLLAFFRNRLCDGLMLHLEIVPDRFITEMCDMIRAFPPGVLHFEVGIQTYDPAVARRIHRQTDYTHVDEHLRFLTREAGALVHADLIAGLPGEGLDGFAAGFDRLLATHPTEIQVGILKRLRGAPITRHTEAWQMVYRDTPPYDILSNKLLSPRDLIRISHFARYWERMGNRGNFKRSLPLLWSRESSPFISFLRWSDWLFERTQETHAVPLLTLMRLFLEYLTVCAGYTHAEVATLLREDYRQNGKRVDTPRFLR
ncbi:MAG: B12-binding domain-containing radical SAM protein [Spartobacteria bacterium]|nr:B12-binding domain-containing radical SAM protein [Spartobacteria bacterium]